MDPVSAPYAALIGLGALLDRLLRSARARAAALLLLGCAFFGAPLLLAPRPSAAAALPLAAFAAVTAITVFGFARAARAAPERRAAAFRAPVIAAAAILIAFKAVAAPWWPRGLFGATAALALPIGISYYVLRAISALVDAARGGLRDARPVEIAGYLGFPPILAVGPIERAGPFLAQRRAERGAELPAASEGALRIVEGLFKTLILCDALALAARPMASDRPNPYAWESGVSWTTLYAYSLFIYLNFSGASDIAIGAARFFGVKVVENFDLPYARPNLSEFWRAWHVSLSTWLRDYLFFPIAKRIGRAAAPIVAPVLVMGACGLWHGFTLPFLVWGLLHGAGLATHQLWLRARRASPALDRACASVAGRAAGAVVTAHFVAFTWLFFAAPDLRAAGSGIAGVVRSAPSSGGWIAAACAAVALWSFVPSIRDAMRRRAAEAGDTMTGRWLTGWRVHLAVILLLVVAARLWLARSAPQGGFVYQGF